MHPDFFKNRYSLSPMQYEFEKFANQFLDDALAVIDELENLDYAQKEGGDILFTRPKHDSLYFDFAVRGKIHPDDNLGHHTFDRETRQMEYRGALFKAEVSLPAKLEKFIETYVQTHDVFTQMLLNQLTALTKQDQFYESTFKLLKAYSQRHPLTFTENAEDANDIELQYQPAFVVLDKKAWDRWEKLPSELDAQWQNVFFNGYGELRQLSCCHSEKCNGTQEFVQFSTDYNDVEKRIQEWNKMDFHQYRGLVVLDVLVSDKELLSNSRHKSSHGYQLGWWNLIVKSVILTQREDTTVELPDYLMNEDF